MDDTTVLQLLFHTRFKAFVSTHCTVCHLFDVDLFALFCDELPPVPDFFHHRDLSFRMKKTKDLEGGRISSTGLSG